MAGFLTRGLKVEFTAVPFAPVDVVIPPDPVSITVTTQPTADGLSSAVSGDTFVGLRSRLTNLGEASASNSEQVGVAVSFTSTGTNPVATGDTISNVRFTYSAIGATPEIVDVAVNITVGTAPVVGDVLVDGAWLSAYNDSTDVSVLGAGPYTISGLPSGIEGSVSGGVLTVTGDPI